MKDSSVKYNIRYLGFESMADGGRRLDFAITASGETPRKASFEVPSDAFSGTNRVSFQETAALCYEKLRAALEQDRILSVLQFRLTHHDIEIYRPRGRRARPKNDA